jgi:hypothetical protein
MGHDAVCSTPEGNYEHVKRISRLLKEVQHLHHMSWARGAEDFLGVVRDRLMLAERRN